jgi:hypothetical protein
MFGLWRDEYHEQMQQQVRRIERQAYAEFEERETLKRIANKKFKCGPFIWFVQDDGRVLTIR